MCADVPGPSRSYSSPNPSMGTDGEKFLGKNLEAGLNCLLLDQISLNAKRQQSLLSSLPTEESAKIKELNEALRLFKTKVIDIGESSDSSQNVKEQRQELEQIEKDIKLKYTDFDFFYIEQVLSNTEIVRNDCEFYFEAARSMYINKKLYFYEAKNFILEHKDEIIKEFGSSKLQVPLKEIDFYLSLKDIPFKKLDSKDSFGDSPSETHHFGKSPVFIYFFSAGKELLKVVYKPRDAKLDKQLIASLFCP